MVAWQSAFALAALLRQPLTQRAGAVARCAISDDLGVPLTPCGGVHKTIIQPAPTDGTRQPPHGALVQVRFTGRFPNETIFDNGHAKEPFEFQLNTDTVVDGMERGIQSMREGEVARLRCEPRWAYGGAGVGSRIPPNATLLYDVELVSWRVGPPVENDAFDMDTYRRALEGKEAGRGQTSVYRWCEGGEDVTFWVPLRDDEGARDVSFQIFPRKVLLSVGTPIDGDETRTVCGTLRGRADPEGSYWVIDDEGPDGQREVQVVVTKAGSYTRWNGVLVEEDEDDTANSLPIAS